MLTASGDMSCMSWDVETGAVLETFAEHSGELTSIATSPHQVSKFREHINDVESRTPVRPHTCKCALWLISGTSACGHCRCRSRTSS
jgi:WD40 repeat protein